MEIKLRSQNTSIHNKEGGGRPCRDHMVVRFTTTATQLVPITTKVVSLNPAHGVVYSIQHYVLVHVILRELI
jgi:hypothetical protein